MSSFENFSGLTLEEASVVYNPEPYGFSGYSNSGTLNDNQIVQNHSVFQAPQQPPNVYRRRKTPVNPDLEVEVVALSPDTLMKKNRFICEICNKGFQRDQNLQLHRRGHNLPWKLKATKSQMENRKKVYVCPEPSCPHHNSNKALGDLTGIKKHFLRKHCPKNFNCLKCTKSYAVLSDWKAHVKNCGTKNYKCDCGLVFSRKDTFGTHKAFCDVLAAETERVSASHPHLDTSSEDSASETMNFYQGNIILPPPPPPGFGPIQHNQLIMPPLTGGFSPINHSHHQFTPSGPALGHIGINNYISISDGPVSMNVTPSTNHVVKHEPFTTNHGRAFPSLTHSVPPHMMMDENSGETKGGLDDSMRALQNYYAMISLQNYHQQASTSAMPLLQTDMMETTMTQELQMGGALGQGVVPPADNYYLMSRQNQNERRARDNFLSLSVGHHGGEVGEGSSSGMNSTGMDDYRVSLGGATNVNLINNPDFGGWGRNEYGEGREWFPEMNNDEHFNAHQTYGFSAGGPSTSRISSGSEWMNMHERN